MRAKDSESEFPVGDARQCAVQECTWRQREDGLAGRSWMLPRAKKPARVKRKIGGRERIANGTAGQKEAFSLANPVGSVGFGELLVRTSARGAVRKYRVESRSRRRRECSLENSSDAQPSVPAEMPEMQSLHVAGLQGLQTVISQSRYGDGWEDV